jgi:F420-non-reducing hydrogenase iron-sulfur subunit
MSDNGDFEPRIVGLLCNWCTYAGADMAGTSRMQYPTNVRFIRLMCSSRVDPQFILKAFELGADGVFIGGCHPGDCHYVTGNYRTEERFNLIRKLIEELGIEPERLRLEWISASEGAVLVDVMNDFVKKLKELGPSPIRSNED